MVGMIGFACKLQLKHSTVNHVKEINFSVCKRHSLCIALVMQHFRKFTLCEIVPRIHCQFVSKLEFSVLVEMFSISRLQRTSSQSVRAVWVRFAPVQYCVTWLYLPNICRIRKIFFTKWRAPRSQASRHDRSPARSIVTTFNVNWAAELVAHAHRTQVFNCSMGEQMLVKESGIAT